MWAWEAEQQEIDNHLERLREQQAPNRRVTRAQRQSAPDGSYLEESQPTANMATASLLDAPIPDEASMMMNNSGGQAEDAGAVGGHTDDVVAEEAQNVTGENSWQTEQGSMQQQQEHELRGAVQNVMESTTRGALGQAPDSTRHLNSPASERVREVIDRRNARLQTREMGASYTWEGFGGARPRTHRRQQQQQEAERPYDTPFAGRYNNRIEDRLRQSPRRAMNTGNDHGRFLAERLERIERGEERRDNVHQDEIRTLRQRYEDDRAGWRRQQEDMARQMQQLQQQLDTMRLQQMQVPPPQPPPPQPPPPPPIIQIPPPVLPPNPYYMQPPQQLPLIQPVQQRVDSPAGWGLQPPRGAQRAGRMATPVGGRTPQGFTPNRRNRADDDYLEDNARQQRHEYIDRKSLKLRTFKGRDVDAWRSLFDDFAEQFNWSEREKKLQLKAHVDDGIRSMFTGLPPDTTADEMMTRLVSRYGVNMTATEVENKLLTIERKSGEDLYTLADRVRALANRAHMPEAKKNLLMRQTFFTALRGNSEMQHWVNLHDMGPPNMNITLDLAIEWEHQHGTTFKLERIRQVDVVADEPIGVKGTSDAGNSDTEIVNKIDYIPLKEMTTQEGRRLAKQNNEMVSLLKKQAYSVLDDDRRSGGRSSSGRSSSSRGGYQSRRSDYSSRSSSSWSRPRRSRSRDKKRDWKSRDKNNKSGDSWRKRSKDRNRDRKDKQGGKFEKKRREKETRVHEVTEESQTESEHSEASHHSQSDSEGESTE